MEEIDTTYNGWKNYQTWNVSLWINNDEYLYNLAQESRGYEDFVARLQDDIEGVPQLFGEECFPALYYQTPDGVSWNDSALDIPRLNEMIWELAPATIAT